MAEQSDPTGPSSRAGGRAPRVESWRARAEPAHGDLVPDPSRTLTASEIGAYTFCPQAWYLQRCRVPVTAMAEERRRSGSGMHRQIGRQTDLVRGAGTLQAVLLIAIGLVILLLAALVLRGLG